ncbi:MAG: hypothetical protein ACP5T0_09250 [Verrucomicrobiia bacterium]
MKTFNQIEEKLISLHPRSPSQRVKNQLFEKIDEQIRENNQGEEQLSAGFLSQLLILKKQAQLLSLLIATTILACSSITIKNYGRSEFTFIKATNCSPIEIVAMSNYSSSIAYYVPNLNNEHNLLTSQILRWTNYSGSN